MITFCEILDIFSKDTNAYIQYIAGMKPKIYTNKTYQDISSSSFYFCRDNNIVLNSEGRRIVNLALNPQFSSMNLSDLKLRFSMQQEPLLDKQRLNLVLLQTILNHCIKPTKSRTIDRCNECNIAINFTERMKDVKVIELANKYSFTFESWARDYTDVKDKIENLIEYINQQIEDKEINLNISRHYMTNGVVWELE